LEVILVQSVVPGKIRGAVIVLIFGLALIGVRTSAAEEAIQRSLSGRIVDPQGLPVEGAEVVLRFDNRIDAEFQTETNHDGVFLLDFPVAEPAILELEITHPHFKSTTWSASPDEVALIVEGASLRVPDIQLERKLTIGFWIATLVFIGVLVLVMTERLHNTAAALLGAAIILTTSMIGTALGLDTYIFDFEQAIAYVDFEVIFLVLGMMIIVGTIERTGIFQWTAYQAYRISGGKIWLLGIILMLLTSIASALLDNVTTMLLVTPITLQIALTLGVNPLALIIPEMLASNVGGIATLIGTPNNILIGSYAGLGFNDFLKGLTPGVLLTQVALTLYVLYIFRREYKTAEGSDSVVLLNRLKENAQITEPEVLKRAGAVFIGTLLLFVLGERLNMVPAVTAMIGAAATLLVVRANVDEILRVVDWNTLLFFMALFMIVGAVQAVGLISLIASGIHTLVGSNLTAAILVTIWGTGMFCLLIPTIPLTAALLPVIGFLTRSIPGTGNALFFSLSLGSALGANNSLIGATNNLVTAGITQRAGYPISFKAFIRVGFPAAMLTMLVGTIYILIRF
jgi:Na+/H+ antiporter NhaD/arsenite permease-like protein